MGDHERSLGEMARWAGCPIVVAFYARGMHVGMHALWGLEELGAGKREGIFLGWQAVVTGTVSRCLKGLERPCAVGIRSSKPTGIYYVSNGTFHTAVETLSLAGTALPTSRYFPPPSSGPSVLGRGRTAKVISADGRPPSLGQKPDFGRGSWVFE